MRPRVGCFQRVGRTVSPRCSPLLRLFLLVALALCAKAQSTPWSYENYFNSSTTPLAQSQTAAAAVLNGLTLHVAVLNIVQNLTFFPDNITYGDGNAYLTDFAASTVVPLLRAGVPENSTCGPFGGPGYAVSVQPSQVDGATLWVLKYIAAAANMTLAIDVVRLPWSVYYQSSKNDTLARVLYTLDVLGYDAVAASVFVLPERMKWSRYLIPHQPYGYVVVTTQPEAATESVVSRAFKWTRPFSPRMWALMVAGVFVSAVLYHWFESNTGSDDFPLPDEPIPDKFARAFFLSAMSSVLFEGFSPHTHEGRLYTAVKAFVFFVSMSCYIAQYAAILGEPKALTQAVTSIDSFGTLSKPVCVRNSAAQVAFVKQNYPNLQVTAVPGLTQAGLLPAIVSGQCVGGLGPDIEIKYGLGGPGIFGPNGFDPGHTFCGLTSVGDKLNFGYYGIPLAKTDRPSVNSSILDAMNVFVAQAINTGAYLNAAETYFPDPASRPQCQYAYSQVSASTRSDPVLDILDMAGLYVVQAVGAVIALIVFLIRMARARQRTLRARASAADAAQHEADEDGNVKPLRAVTRRFVSATGEVKTVMLDGAPAAHLPAITRRVPADLLTIAERDIDGGAWGERTGMERRLTNMLQELSAQVAEMRATR